jgi:predicted enzyme related to lactoylglutathione lyase
MPRVIHFEIHADDPERAIQFYNKLLGWDFNRWEGPMPYWLIKTGTPAEPGINGGLIKRQCPIDGQAVIAYVCTVDVPAIDTYVQKAQGLGATVALSKMPIPGVGWLAYCKDTEGNVFGMMQADPKAG